MNHSRCYVHPSEHWDNIRNEWRDCRNNGSTFALFLWRINLRVRSECPVLLIFHIVLFFLNFKHENSAKWIKKSIYNTIPDQRSAESHDGPLGYSLSANRTHGKYFRNYYLFKTVILRQIVLRVERHSSNKSLEEPRTVTKESPLLAAHNLCIFVM